MSDDWQVGDLALCVSDNWEPVQDADPKVGSLQTVEEVHSAWDEYCEGLDFVGVRPIDFDERAYPSSCFKKIRPLTDEERTQAIADLRIPQRVQA